MKQAAIIGGWLLIAMFAAVSLFLGGMFYGAGVNFGGIGIATIAGTGVVFKLGMFWERYKEEFSPT